MKKIQSFLFILLIQVSLIALGLEGGLRIWYFFKNQAKPPLAYITSEIGWRPSENVSHVHERKIYGKAAFSTLENGFRRYDNPLAEGTKLFVAGDSFTHAYHVSDGKTFYDQLANLIPDLQVFAYAAGGYGTLQESMVLNESLDATNASIVLWQFSGNDFINNDWLLESRSSENSSHMLRPYLIDGEPQLRHPDGWFGDIAQYSFLARRLLVIRGSIQKRSSGSIEDSLHINHPDLIRSIASTKQILEGAIKSYPDKTFIAFFAGSEHYPWELLAFKEVCTIQLLHCVPQVHEELAKAKLAGAQVDGGTDGHWTVFSHTLAGKILAKEIRQIIHGKTTGTH